MAAKEMVAGDVVEMLPSAIGAEPLRPKENSGAIITLELPFTTRPASVVPGNELPAAAAPNGADVMLNWTSVRFRSATRILPLPTCATGGRMIAPSLCAQALK